MAAASVAAASGGGVGAIASAAGSAKGGAAHRVIAVNSAGVGNGAIERERAEELWGGSGGVRGSCPPSPSFRCYSGLGAADGRRAQQQLATPAAAAIGRVREGTTCAAELADARHLRMPHGVCQQLSVRRAPGNLAATARPFTSDSALRNGVLRRRGSLPSLDTELRRALAITRLAGSPSTSSPFSLTSTSRFLVKSLAEEKEAEAVVVGEEEDEVGTKIWLSDVVATKGRAYFRRPWTGKDIAYLSHMLVLHVACLAAPFTFTWDAFTLFLSLYVVTGMLGITLSYHRHLSHKSFKIPKWLEYAFAYCGVHAMQGDPLEWVSSHRYHHAYCDTPMDPHSPKEGFWHSHMGWLLDDVGVETRLGKRTNVNDMEDDAFYQFIRKTYVFHVVALPLLLFAWGGFPYLIWGVAVRTVFVYHITWFVNSASHVWGSQKWNTGDLSRNNWWVALLAFGEGWHNNHHAFEYSARHGLEWWQLDATWYLIKALEKVGLATKVKLPKPEHMARLSQ